MTAMTMKTFPVPENANFPKPKFKIGDTITGRYSHMSSYETPVTYTIKDIALVENGSEHKRRVDYGYIYKDVELGCWDRIESIDVKGNFEVVPNTRKARRFTGEIEVVLDIDADWTEFAAHVEEAIADFHGYIRPTPYTDEGYMVFHKSEQEVEVPK